MNKFNLSIISYNLAIIERDMSKELIDLIEIKIKDILFKSIKYGVVNFYITYNQEFDKKLMDILFELKARFPHIKIFVVDYENILEWDINKYISCKEIMKTKQFPPICKGCYSHSLETMVSNSEFCVIIWDGKNKYVKNAISFAKNKINKVKLIMLKV